ncbi:unnamed protein product [Sphagnum troendelagicum]|uniref:GH3-like protein n=1 Tax=Sphagnum troendelagicum TaxID=128251 RepID=A0ABP0TYG8_9BRYO
MPSRRDTDFTAPDFDPDAFLDLVAADVGLIQRQKLHDILSRNANVEYLQRHGLNGRTDVASFKQCLPVINYQDVETDILRLVNGDTSAPILTAEPIVEFQLSSGTMGGKPKYIPTTARYAEYSLFYQSLVNAMCKKQFKEWRNGKSLDLRSAGKLTDTPSGLKAGSATTNYLKSAMFTDPRIEPDVSCSPIEVYLCDDFNQATYCHLMCSLTQAAEIVKFHSLFAASLVAAVQILQKCWVEMCEDIRSGTPNAKILNPELRRAMEKILKPDPQLAAMIERECSKNDWAGIIPRIWPNTVVITTILSGSMQHYVPILKHFAGNNIALVSLFYGSCECHLLGLNVRLNCPTDQVEYMIWPESAYFEFIPVAADDSHADNIAPHSTGKKTRQLVDTADVELGKEYEIVITTVCGLYRYRVGDVLKVKGFRKTTPIFEYIGRQNVVLSIASEKTDEAELNSVVHKAARQLEGTGTELAEFSSMADMLASPAPCYVLFWEITARCNGILDAEVLQKCTNTLDLSFNPRYRRWRNEGQIGPLELRIVTEGAFKQLMDSAVSRGTSSSQYKTPRHVKSPSSALEILDAAVVATFKSHANPMGNVDPPPS